MKILFAGPSLSGEIAAMKRTFPGIDFRAPAACGDLLRAVEEGATAIGLVDGYFGELPSVWHKEILYALERGVVVGGGASMGALRAAECAPFGMVGLGTIYADYAEGRLMDDEAVALVHGPAEMGWMPLSVPWVDFEATIGTLLSMGLATEKECETLLLAGRFTHFSSRTFARAVEDCSFVDAGRRQQLMVAMKGHRSERKRTDAKAVVAWLDAITCAVAPHAWRFMATSHWELLRAEVSGVKSVGAGSRAA